MTPRTQIDQILAQADRIGADWAGANEETDGAPSAKAWQADDDARRELSHDAVEALRQLLALVDKGEDDLDLARPAPEIHFMQWDGGPADEPYEEPGPEGPLLDHGQIYTVCPRCHTVNGGIYEVDRAERWNQADVVLQPETVAVYGAREGRGWGQLGSEANPAAGLPMLSIWVDKNADFHTHCHRCATCDQPVDLPEWVESRWP